MKNKWHQNWWSLILVGIIAIIFFPFTLGFILIDFLIKSKLKSRYRHFFILICIILATFLGVKWLDEIIFSQVDNIKVVLEKKLASKEENLIFEKNNSAGNAPQIKNSEEEKYFLVAKVIDGDTVVLNNGQKVRYIGMDTPELYNSRKQAECYGKEAKEKNKELVLNKNVRLVRDISNTDRYGRLLRYVYVGNDFINMRLVKEGFAFATAYPPDIKYELQFKEAEREAVDNKRGLWNKCRRLPADLNSIEQKELNLKLCLIKGNIEDAKKIYYYPGCPNYEDITISEQMGEKWFCRESRAVAAGWHKAKGCPWVPRN